MPVFNDYQKKTTARFPWSYWNGLTESRGSGRHNVRREARA